MLANAGSEIGFFLKRKKKKNESLLFQSGFWRGQRRLWGGGDAQEDEIEAGTSSADKVSIFEKFFFATDRPNKLDSISVKT
jgi:hypothetical protein